MKYMALIYEDEKAAAQLSEQQVEALIGAHMKYSTELDAAGKLKGGDPLQPSSTATTIQVDAGGKVITTDGPYAETKEQLAGFYLLDCKDLDEAIQLAAGICKLQIGYSHVKVEVRPVMELPE